MKTTILNVKEEDGVGSSPELLREKLLEIFDDFDSHRETTTEDVLNEAFQLCERVENEQLGCRDFRMLFDDTKAKLGTYHAASVAMMMFYALFSSKTNIKMKNRLLLDRIWQRYRRRHWMAKIEMLLDGRLTPTIMGIPIHTQTSQQPVILQVDQAEINILSPGNIIGNTIHNGKQ